MMRWHLVLLFHAVLLTLSLGMGFVPLLPAGEDNSPEPFPLDVPSSLPAPSPATDTQAGLLSPSPSPSPSVTPGSPAPLNEDRSADLPPADDLFLDRVHSWSSTLITDKVFQFDSWFGDVDTLESEIDKPWIRVRLGGELKEKWKFEFKNRFRVVVPLPLLEDRLGAYIGSDADDEYEDDQDYFDREKEDSDSNITAGLNYKIRKTENLQLSTKFGVQFKIPPVFYFKPRLEYIYTTGRWLFKPIQYVYYYTDDGFGETTKLEINRFLGSRLLLRSYSKATYSEDSEGVDLSQEFDLQYLNFDIRHGSNYAVSLEWESTAHTWPSFKCDQHQLTLRLYRSIWRHWFRVGLGPRLTWERMKPGDDEDFPEYWKNARPSLLLFVEILFEEGDSFSSDKYNPFVRR